MVEAIEGTSGGIIKLNNNSTVPIISRFQYPHRKRRKPLSIDEKWMVVQVFQQCDEERSKVPYIETRDAHSWTSTYTAVGRRQVVEIIKYFRETGNVPPVAKAGNQTVHKRQIPVSLETEIREFILNRHIACVTFKQVCLHLKNAFDNTLVFLPPYSPYLNPIEHKSAQAKAIRKKIVLFLIFLPNIKYNNIILALLYFK